MTKRSHNWSDSEGVGDLVNGSKPGPDVGDAAWSREAEDVVQKLLGWLDPTSSQLKAQKVDIMRAELKLLGIECTASSRSLLQKPADSVEVLLDCSIVEQVFWFSNPSMISDFRWV